MRWLCLNLISLTTIGLTNKIGYWKVYNIIVEKMRKIERERIFIALLLSWNSWHHWNRRRANSLRNFRTHYLHSELSVSVGYERRFYIWRSFFSSDMASVGLVFHDVTELITWFKTSVCFLIYLFFTVNLSDLTHSNLLFWPFTNCQQLTCHLMENESFMESVSI